MKYLLDTHAVLWVIGASNLLSKKVKDIIENPDNQIYASSVSFWEIAIKYRLGKLRLSGFRPSQIPDLLIRSNIELIEINPEDASTYSELKDTDHKDPFDRMLICQAIRRKLNLITKDKQLKKYHDLDLKTIW